MAQTKAADPKDTRIAELERLVAHLELLGKQQDTARGYKDERDYLWAELANLEAFANTAPTEQVGRFIGGKLKAALDGFKPMLPAPRSMP